MSKNNIKPHDAFVKKAMSRTKVAVDFFQNQLPEEVLKLIDLKSLKKENTAFLSNILGEGITDFLYSIKFQGDKKGYICVLLEHQSSPDKLMTFRIQKYMLRICEENLRKHPKEKFPVIYPLIYYSGKAKYNAPRLFYELFQNKDLAQKFFTEPVKVIETGKIADEQLERMGDSLSKEYNYKMMIWLMKHIYDKSIMSWITTYSEILKKISEEDFKYLEDMVLYISEASNANDVKLVFEGLQGILNKDKAEKIMTYADQLRAEGKKEAMKNIHQLKVESKLEGKLEGKLEMVRKMLMQGMDATSISQITELTLKEIENLKN